MPLTWDDLSNEEQGFYNWFYDCFHNNGCGLWSPDADRAQHRCPALRQQADQCQPDGPIYYPEAVFGNPRNPIWFVGINSGGGGLNDPYRPICPNRLDDTWREMTPQEYAEHHLAYNWNDDHSRPTNCARRIVAHYHGEDNAAENLTMTNTVHCKARSPRFANGTARDVLLPRCAGKTFKMLRHWAPRCVVTFHGHVLQRWLVWFLHEEAAKPVAERIIDTDYVDGDPAALVDEPHTVSLRWTHGDAAVTDFITLKHPSRFGCPNARVHAIVDLIGHSLDVAEPNQDM